MSEVQTNRYYDPGDKVKVTCLSDWVGSRLKIGQLLTIRKDHLNGYVSVEESGHGRIDRWRLARLDMTEEVGISAAK